MRRLSYILAVLLIIGAAWLLYQAALSQDTYNGLPTVPCVDTTKPIRQSYTFSLSITINDHHFPLDSTIGHDYGKCLHDIFVKDTSGTVYVQTNNNEQFTLGNFFDVWHKTLTSQQIFQYQARSPYSITVYFNGKRMKTVEQTPIYPNEKISIIYQ